jgi:hypothetical protein
MPSTGRNWADKFVADALNDPDPLLRELDAESDELSVRSRLAAGKFNTWESGVVEEWLRRKSDDRQAAAEVRAEAREEETLSIAREANRIASEARAAAYEQARWAKWAAIIATVAAIIATVAATAGK